MDMRVKQWAIYLPYFKEREFVCKCEKCQKKGVAYVHETLVDMLYMARKAANIPFVIISGCRCLGHNKKINGSENSDHLYKLHIINNETYPKNLCQAVDIRTQNDRERYIILCALLSVGFTRLGIGKGFIHAGISREKTGAVVWVY